LIFADRESKEGYTGRAMQVYYFSFAFTHRFLFTRERAGETRAEEISD
jgi:hypothetical protein